MGFGVKRRRYLQAQRLAHPWACGLIVLVAWCLWPACGPARTAPVSAPVRTPAAPPPEAAPGGPYGIPELDGITIDGSGDDWKARGLSLDVLTPAPSFGFDPGEFDARARLGWDSRGLLLWVEVTDTLPQEAEPGQPLWTGDALELFVAERVGGQQLVQHVIAPFTSRHI